MSKTKFEHFLKDNKFCLLSDEDQNSLEHIIKLSYVLEKKYLNDTSVQQKILIQSNSLVFNTSLLFACWSKRLIPLFVSIETTELELKNIGQQITVNKKIFIHENENELIKEEISKVSHFEVNQFIEEINTNEEDLALIMLSSGSSGKPKVFGFKFQALLNSALSVSHELELNEESTWGLCLPVYHFSGLMILLRCFFSGQKVREINLKKTSSLKSISHLSLVPTQLRDLMKNNLLFLTRIKKILIGGAPLDLETLNECHQNKINIIPSYGMSEMASTVAVFEKIIAKKVFYKNLSHVKVERFHDQLQVEGESIFDGVFEDKVYKKNKSLKFITNDKCEFKGHLFTITSRVDDVFLSGGKNIDPNEIKKAILEIEAVTQVKIIPVIDEHFGEVAVAFIEFIDNQKVNDIDFKKLLKEKISSYKIPKYFFNYPKNFNGIKPSLNDFKLKLDEYDLKTSR